MLAVLALAGSSPSGTRALVLWGVEGQLAPIRYQMLGADGALVGNQGTIDETWGKLLNATTHRFRL